MKNDAVENGSDETRQATLYPYTSLVPSLKIADAVKELGGARSPVSKSSLAAHFKESEKSASFLQRVSSAKAFGLISGRSDYSLTEAAKRYYFPTNEGDKSNALLEFLAAPSSFAEVIRRYDGDKLPSREILGNVFQRDLKVPESWKERAAAFFENSAQFIGVLDEKRFLRVKSTQHASSAQSEAAKAVNSLPSTPDEELRRAINSGKVPKEFSLNEKKSFYLNKERDREVTLDCPFAITQNEFDRICTWIKATWIIETENKNEQI
jgi:hypothetical protein